ncbi:hypothetical protein J2R76_003675 [Bradyrhizobium sp. USDA 4532]|nr:hypothetical protein [Bradyrhizobium sp. USDA 4545]MCP1920084.1 hypothetical protein [Bradyrhizobium sp. USDA 4532]
MVTMQSADDAMKLPISENSKITNKYANAVVAKCA